MKCCGDDVFVVVFGVLGVECDAVGIRRRVVGDDAEIL